MIDIIKNNGNFAGNIEISIAYELFEINIAEYKEIRNNNNEFINLSFINYINNDNNENKNLLILTNINNNHFNIAYYNNSDLDYNYQPIFNNFLFDMNIINNENDINNNDKKEDIYNSTNNTKFNIGSNIVNIIKKESISDKTINNPYQIKIEKNYL